MKQKENAYERGRKDARLGKYKNPYFPTAKGNFQNYLAGYQYEKRQNQLDNRKNENEMCGIGD